ncbi:ankyrin repeat domain-containing protein 39-like, partial [Anneissia japonica]|uniref:ankyrin repeat domain-containing protein 39-like n=1 Tax=Anneissia japonica TaxID=1529436 RepID=UPI001425739D
MFMGQENHQRSNCHKKTPNHYEQGRRVYRLSHIYDQILQPERPGPPDPTGPEQKIGGVKPDGATALYVSVQNGHTDACGLLIQSGANKDIQKKNGYTALHTSASNGHTDISRLLIQSGANKDIQAE